MKKILSLVLAALMVFSVLPVAFADEEVTAIAEEAVEEVSEYQEAIDFLKLLGIYKGNGTGDAADEAVTRWQMALFVSRFITGKVDAAYWATTENDSGFADVEDFEGASEEALGAISFASQKGIVNGVGEGQFDPETGVQYREAITMIVRALGYTYKASGYPWSYINKAREIGLLDEISGVAYTDQINRDVVAQLLYNALFIEENDTTVAESIFNVGKTVVLITATNDITYADDEKVLRSDYVRFTELDVQGEPTGASYHVAYDKFGLADDAAANAAVGTPYFVYYVNGCADIIYAESLATVYENRGDNTTVSYSTSSSRNYLTIDGTKYQIVSLYNELNKLQSWNQDAAGTDQVKLYQAYGATVYGVSDEYVVDSLNRVFKADGQGGYVLYAQYSSVMECYYRIGDNGKWELLDLEDILKEAGSASGAFKQLTGVSSNKLAYADFVVSDASMDGYADRVTMKQYGFGKISYDKRKNNDNKDQETFNIKYVDESKYATTSTLSLDKGLQTTYKSNKSTGLPFTTEFRWTGMQRADVPNNSYVLFYVDEANKEVDIIEVIGAKADDADTSYTVKGYLRGYDVAKDLIYLDADYTTYAVGYDNLYLSPLKDRTTTSTANNNLQANINLIQPKLNTYVELVIVDNKVVMINAAGNANNFVILDSFVSFEEDGIVANAWTTVSDEYTQIKINAYNGWTVGGFDYYLYFLSNMFAGSQYASVLPVKLDTLYQVVYENEGVYNLTDPTVAAANYDFLKVNTYGYIEGTDGSSIAAGKYIATNASDYWMILVKDADGQGNPSVISYNGILNPVVDFNAVDVYKVKDKDYVVVADDMSEIVGFNNLSGKTTQYMMFNTMVSGNENATLFIQSTPYQWSVLMKDVYTGATSMVKIDPALVPAGWNGYMGAYDQVGLVNGEIYAVVDGTLYNTTATYDFADVAEFYGSATNATFGTITMKGADGWTSKETTGISAVSLRDQLAELLIAKDYPSWINRDHSSLNDNLDTATIYMQQGEPYKFLTNNLDTINGMIKAADMEYVVDYVITAEGKVTAWINAGEIIGGTATLVGWTEGGETNDAIKAKAPVVRWDENGEVTKYSCAWTGEEFTNKNGTYVFTVTGSIPMSGNATAIGEGYNISTNMTVTGVTITVTREGLDDIVYTYEF